MSLSNDGSDHREQGDQDEAFFEEEAEVAEEVKTSQFWDGDNDDSLGLDEMTGEGVELLQEAHEAMNRLYQKTHKRHVQTSKVRRADNWH